MRPIKLIMRAFGPYADTVEIDFAALGESGIYLVTGDTGAGKTTIFDAISFALFGHASGTDRNTRSLRSDFADPTSDTSVELEFSYRGETYRIWRRPGYERAKKRGEGTTFQAPDAQLDRPGKAPITRVRDVDAAVEEILGIDRNQFAQIVMIAQGDFRKLLSAGTDERIKIFRKLFDTEEYLSFQKDLADRKRELETDHSDIEKALLIHAKTARFDENSAERLELDRRLDDNTVQAEWLKNALAETTARDRASVQDASARLERAKKECDETLKAEHELQQALQMKQELDRACARRTELLGLVDQAQASFDAAAALQPERNALAERTAIVQKDLPLYEELDQALVAIAAISLDKENAETKADEFSKDIDRYRAKLNLSEQSVSRLADAEKLHAQACIASNEAEARFKDASSCKEAWLAMRSTEKKAREAEANAEQAETRAKNAAEQHQAVEQQVIDATARRDALLSAPERLARCESAKTAAAEALQRAEKAIETRRQAEKERADAHAAADAAMSAYLKAKKTSDDAHAAWICANNAYLDGQAGLLASELGEGRPCPVCGSTSHPKLAVIPDSTPSKQEVERLQRHWADLSERTNAAAESSSKAQTELAEKERVLAHMAESDGTTEQLDERAASARKNLADAEASRCEAQAVVADLDRANALLQKVQTERSRASEAMRASTELASKARSEAERLAATAEAERAALPYQDEAALEAEYEKASKMRAEALDKQASAERSVNELEQAREDIKRATEKLEQARQLLDDANRKRTAATAQLDAKNSSVASMRTKLVHATKAEAEHALAVDRNRMAAIDEKTKAAQALLDKRKADLSAMEGSIETMQATLERMPKHDAERIAEEKQARSKAYDQANEALSSIRSKLETNETTLEKVTRLAEKAGAIDTLFGEVAALSDTANGKLAGKDKIAFETYVQSIYFDRMAEAANKRFIAMTNGRYELKRRRVASSKTGQSGLDLDVFDNYTGKSRDASSLSGGESFKASLALALGLSDVVQAYAGGIQLDTMFIDEGFGSLDQESLQLAIKTLTELSGGDKLIGIISHVDELKESIDRKIVVTRGRNGSKLSIEA